MEQIAIGNALTQPNANGEFTSLTETYMFDNRACYPPPARSGSIVPSAFRLIYALIANATRLQSREVNNVHTSN